MEWQPARRAARGVVRGMFQVKRFGGNTSLSPFAPRKDVLSRERKATLKSPRASAPASRTTNVIVGWICTVLSVSAGCSGQSNFLTGGPTVGQLKTSLSHLEYENEQLKKRTAKLEQESRSMEDRLVQEQINNGDLTARLDDARNLLRDRGVEPDVRLGSRRRGDEDDSSADDASAGARTMPTGRAARQRRKPPFAQIAGPGNELPSSEDDGSSATQSRKRRDVPTNRASRRTDDDLDHHSFHNGSLQWLPVADATGDLGTQVR